MMREVRLYGVLAEKFGRVFHFDVRSPAEAIAALKATVPGFKDHLARFSRPGYHVFVGKKNYGRDQLCVRSGDESIKIAPVVAGKKNGGIFQTILGIVLVTVGVFTQNYGLVAYGAAMIFGGISMMLAKTPEKQDVLEGQSYAFNGPINTSEQGNPVPIAYGTLIVGSQVASAGLYVEDGFTYTSMSPSPVPDNLPGYVPPWKVIR